MTKEDARLRRIRSGDRHGTRVIRVIKIESLEPRLPLTAELAWRPFGPTGGDVLDIAFSPLDSNVVLAGVAPGLANAGGSLFRSTDGGNSWFEVPEFRPSRSVYDIEFALEGTVYVASFDSIWKSQDSGTTWQQLR